MLAGRERRGVPRPGRVVVLSLDGARWRSRGSPWSFLAGGAVLPQAQDRACNWEKAMMVLGFSVGGRHGEALEQPWLGDERALWRPSIPPRSSAASRCEPAWGNSHRRQGSEQGPSYHLAK